MIPGCAGDDAAVCGDRGAWVVEDLWKGGGTENTERGFLFWAVFEWVCGWVKQSWCMYCVRSVNRDLGCEGCREG